MMSPAVTDLSSVPSGGQLAFLRRVASDDQFRAEVEADPQAKLAEFGLHIAEDDLPTRVTLPGKSALGDSVLEASSGPPLRWNGFLG